jgi:hypothetical protein
MRHIALSFALVLAALSPLRAQAHPTAGFLFSYRPAPGRREAFEEGYARHLGWHEAHADSLDWYAWDVLAGPGLGLFVDGTFGRPFAAFDARVDPAGDARDAAATFGAHGEPVYRRLLVLREDLGTSTPLERGTPTPLVEGLTWTSAPGTLEEHLGELRSLARSRPLQSYTVYEAVAGGADVHWVVMVWRGGFGTFDERATDPTRTLIDIAAAAGDRSVRLVANEIWLYRADLTYRGGVRER